MRNGASWAIIAAILIPSSRRCTRFLCPLVLQIVYVVSVASMSVRVWGSNAYVHRFRKSWKLYILRSRSCADENSSFWGGMAPCRFVLGTNVTFQRYIELHRRRRQWNCLKRWYLIQIHTASYTRRLTLCAQHNNRVHVYQHTFTSSEQKIELLTYRIRLFLFL
jgi:hypothetical protein